MGFEAAQLQEGVSLAPLTTLGVGGPARFFYRAQTLAGLEGALRWAQTECLPVLILGGGSNLVIADSGFSGLVLQPDMKGIAFEEQGGDVLVTAQAGERWDDLVAATVARNLAGLECLSGIPGRVGAAPIQNIGAYGQELATTFVDLLALDQTNGTLHTMDRDACHFGYRTSRFKHGDDAGRLIVLQLRLRLAAGAPPTITYPDLRQRLSENVSLAETRATVLAVRSEKSMLENPADPNARSCGSFFTNPVLTAEAYAHFRERDSEGAPHYPAPEGQIKLSAAWLIERAGYGRGLERGAVGLSQKHCLALINRGGARAADVQALMHEIQAGVQARFGVKLEPEPVWVE